IQLGRTEQNTLLLHHMNTHTHKHTHSLSRTHTHTLPLTHTHTHTHTHTDQNTRTHTNTHTNTSSYSTMSSFRITPSSRHPDCSEVVMPHQTHSNNRSLSSRKRF